MPVSAATPSTPPANVRNSVTRASVDDGPFGSSLNGLTPGSNDTRGRRRSCGQRRAARVQAAYCPVSRTSAPQPRSMAVPRQREADEPRRTACSEGPAMPIERGAEPVELAALVEDPTRVATVPPGRIPALLSQLSA